MITLINAALSRIRTVTLVFCLLVLCGILAFKVIPKESSPDISIPIIYISLSMEGISPEDADRLLVRPVEQEVKSLEGLKKYTSSANEGHASVVLEYSVGFDVDQAMIEVREKIDRVKSSLPNGADEPIVNEVNLSQFPVINITLSGDIEERVLSTLAKTVQERLESLPGVLTASLLGTRTEMVEIIIDPELMASYNLSQTEIIALINNNNRLVTAGNLDTGAGRFSVKVPGLIENLDDILNLPIKVDNNRVVRFKDIAVAQRTYMDRQSVARVNGKPAVTIEIAKRSGENIISTIDQVKAVVEHTRPYWPEGLIVGYTQDNSIQIRTQLSDLFNSVILATLLVFIVIVWALGWRSASLVGIAIPSSFLTGILILYALNISLNMVVLFALILCVGMLVDGAIVVTEYADRRMHEGANRALAYREAASRMAWPVIASTLTTISVFIPLLFWPGIPGEFMKYLPLTVIFTLGSSLIMALIAVPNFGFMFGKASPISVSQQQALTAASQGDPQHFTGLTGRYLAFLVMAIRRPWLSILGIVILTVSIITLFVLRFPGVEFFPEVDSDFGQVVVKARGNLSLAERDALVRQVERRVLQVPGIKSVTSKISATYFRDFSADAIGVLQLEFVDWQQRKPANAILADAVAATADLPGIIVESKKADSGPGGGADVQLEFSANDSKLLNQAVAQFRTLLEQDKRFKDVSDDRPLPGIEWRIDVDRKEASKFGVDIGTVGSSIQMITNGLKVGAYRPDDSDDELDIRVRYPYDGRDLDRIDALSITVQGQQVPISNFIQRSAQASKGHILRSRGALSFTLQANLYPQYLKQLDSIVQAIRQQIEAKYASGELSDQVQIKFAGNQEDQQETGVFLIKALFIAIFAMVLILLTQFNSLYQTFLILLAAGLSMVGVCLGTILTGDKFGIVMSGVGIISLVGIAVNNNIVLIDTFNAVRNQGLSTERAILMTCGQRLRPVLLTTITTILGLMPMVFQLNIDFVAPSFTLGAPSSQWWTQLSTAVAGGLTFTTVLTLIMTPCLLVIGERLRRRSQHRRP